jgi:hypothetical protein
VKPSFHIKNYCHIKEESIFFNGKKVFGSDHTPFSLFAKDAYNFLGISYNRFFKMDNLSKLAFLAAELILKETDTSTEDLALVFSNRASSLDTDRKHQRSIENKEHYYPSPSVFVYTLPNICLGEICIRHKQYSENSFFIFDSFKAEPLFDQANSLLELEKASKVLCGWMEFDNGKYEAFLYLVGNEGATAHTIKEINRLYTA